MRLLARLILIPLGIGLAATVALAFLGVAALVQPDVGQAVAVATDRMLERAIAALFDGEAAIRQFGWSAVLLSRFSVVVLFLPVTLMAVLAEGFGLRSWFVHAIGTGAVTAALPFALMPDLVGGPTPIVLPPVTGLLATAGAVAGTIYWVIAGHSAGPEPKSIEERATMQAPKALRR